jgi:hypothetical protein
LIAVFDVAAVRLRALTLMGGTAPDLAACGKALIAAHWAGIEEVDTLLKAETLSAPNATRATARTRIP